MTRSRAAIAQPGGRVSTMTIARVGFSPSREAREKVGADVVSGSVRMAK